MTLLFCFNRIFIFVTLIWNEEATLHGISSILLLFRWLKLFIDISIFWSQLQYHGSATTFPKLAPHDTVTEVLGRVILTFYWYSNLLYKRLYLYKQQNVLFWKWEMPKFLGNVNTNITWKKDNPLTRVSARGLWFSVHFFSNLAPGFREIVC